MLRKLVKLYKDKRGAIATSTMDLAAATAGAILLTLSFIPIVTGVTEEAKVAKAKGEVGSLGEALSRFNQTTTLFPARNADGVDNSIAVLISLRPFDPELRRTDGSFDIPQVRNPHPGATEWNNFLRNIATVDAMANHLIDDGDPGDPKTGRPASGANRYRDPTGSGLPVTWKGSYITNLSTDPWGKNYIVLVRAFYDSTTGVRTGERLQGWIISAGPNGILETDPTSINLNNNPATELSLNRQKDDIGFPFFSAR